MSKFAFGRVSSLRVGFNMYMMLIALSVITGFLHNAGAHIYASIGWYWFAPALVKINDDELSFTWKILPIILQFCGWHPLIVTVLVVCVSEDQNVGAAEGKYLGWAVRAFARYIRKVVPRFDVGINADDSCGKLLNDIKVLLTEIHEVLTLERGIHLSPVVVASRIRDNGLAHFIEEEGDGTPLPATEVLNMERDCVNTTRRAVIMASVVVMVMYWEAYVGAIIFLATMIYSFLRFDDQPVMISGDKEARMADGVYRLSKRLLWFTLDMSIGVVHDGVMHGCYHGCHSNDLLVGKRKYTPYYVSVVADLITWGGIPKMVLPRSDDRVLVNREGETYRSTMMVNVNIDHSLRAYTWLGVSKPGESGSPIWIDRDGNRLLAGLVGRWCQHAGLVTEISVQPMIHEEVMTPGGGKIKVVRYPGSGKTFKEVPAIISSALMRTKGRIMVIGPTRVVARELFNSVNRSFRQVGLSMHGENMRRNPRARIQITTHATFIKMLSRQALEVRGIETLVIDEAHVDDTSTKLARRYGTWMAEQGLRVYEMSATIDGDLDDRSNFPIEDIKMNGSSKPIDLVKKLVDDGSRVLMFVAGHKGKNGAKEVTEVLKQQGYKALALSRMTYADVSGKMNNPEYRVIVTTNIAECGLNIDCDCVVDTGVEYTMFEDDEVVTGSLVKRSEASRVQRRGRCGRWKKGTYYYWDTGAEEPSGRVSEYEAKIMVGGRSWCPVDDGGTWMISDEQFDVALENGWNPRYVEMIYGLNGEKMKEPDIGKMVNLWLKGNKVVVDCGCGKCGGSYTWFDERLHDELMALKSGIGVITRRKMIPL
uniref:Genome polyprotein n=1 Tax=Cryptocercus pudacuoensis jingmenvirus TaxID=3133548 RepID=A0AAT9J9V6_9FLAV